MCRMNPAIESLQQLRLTRFDIRRQVRSWSCLELFPIHFPFIPLPFGPFLRFSLLSALCFSQYLRGDPRDAGELCDLATRLIRHNDRLIAEPSSLFRVSDEAYSFLSATIGSTCIALRAGM